MCIILAKSIPYILLFGLHYTAQISMSALITIPLEQILCRGIHCGCVWIMDGEDTFT